MPGISKQSSEVLIIGAGAAGLSAALELARRGFRSRIVEARDRAGGRIFTVIDRELKAPVELGAEFVHGLPPEIWTILQAQRVTPMEVAGDNWCFRNGRLCECDFFSEVDELLERLNDKGHDEAFVDFLRREGSHASQETRDWALSYITGFHAADPACIGIHGLVKTTKADEQIEGHRAFRIPGGYGWLVSYFEKEIEGARIPLHLNTSVEKIHWMEGEVTVSAEVHGTQISYCADKAIITVPLGVLKSGDIRFTPELPAAKVNALAHLGMGNVERVTLVFKERFWDEIVPPGSSKSLAEMSFLFSQEEWFPTWWSTMPLRLPVLTGWSPFTQAERLSGQSRQVVVDKAVTALSRILEMPFTKVHGLVTEAYFHDWKSDPFSRGAYSYICVNGEAAEEELGRPLDNTLYFAGEATDVSGHFGTVHGAIASGLRAAAEIAGVAGIR